MRRSTSTFLPAAIVLILAIAAPALPGAARGEARAAAPEARAAARGAQAAARGPLARAVVAVGLTVGDLDRSVAFFTRVLDFDKVAEREIAGDGPERLYGVFGMRARVARLRLGDEAIELTEYLAPKGRPVPDDARSNDRSFQHIAIIVSDMAAAYRRLREHRVVHASPGPQTLPDWNPAAGGIQAFYFKDPDGHALEILAFPPDKGDPKWRRPGGRLFLGIDHTAIVVSDTEASLRFYRDALGLRVAGASENYGIEQERLNNVFGARLRITALRAAAGPGIELLEYLAPAGGRPAPADLRANDLLHWHTIMRTDDPAAAAAPVRAAAGRLVSPGAVPLDGGAAPTGGSAVPPDGGAGEIRSGILVRDPDGHGILLAHITGGAR